VESTSAGPAVASPSEGAAESKTSALDGPALLERFGSDGKLVRALAKTFAEDCPEMMARIRKALTARDAAALADAAHALKGSVGNFGPTGAFETAREIEKEARQGKLDTAWEMYATLEDEIALLLPALQAVREQKKRVRRPARRPKTSGRKR